MNSEVPFLFLERGYFLDIQYFFGNKSLSGFKFLCGICNLNCYYCHRVPHFQNAKEKTLSEVLEEMDKWEPYNIATLTGGEITLIPTQAICLMKELHRRNKYVVFSTNATNVNQISKMVKLADVIKIDLKASHRNMKKVCGRDYYDNAIEAISMCALSKKPTEVKVIIHQFTHEDDIRSRLIDLEEATGFPKNMIIEFQVIHDFLNTGIGVKEGDKYRNICKKFSHLPEVALFKEYGRLEKIQILRNGDWELFGEKEIPLAIKKTTKGDDNYGLPAR